MRHRRLRALPHLHPLPGGKSHENIVVSILHGTFSIRPGFHSEKPPVVEAPVQDVGLVFNL